MATKATLTIRQARVDEFDQVMDFYAQMIDEMRDTDFDVCWEHGVHPSPAFLRASVDAGEAYVGLVDAGADGAGEDRAPLIASAMVLNGEGDAGYEHAPWRVTAEPDEVLVVHVLGTLPAYHGRGFARAMVEACIDVARSQQEGRAPRHVHHQRARPEPLRIVRLRELRHLRGVLRLPRPLRRHVRARPVGCALAARFF